MLLQVADTSSDTLFLDFFLQTMTERRRGRRDGIQTTTHTTGATEVIHQTGYLFWRLVLVKLAPTAPLLYVYLLHL